MSGSGPTLFARAPEDASLADPLPAAPLDLLQRWLDEARERGAQRNPTAMTVATRDRDGALSARVVLCRGYDAEQGFLVFYTNRQSRKGEHLAHHAHAAAVLHWDALGRQVRIEGPIRRSPDAESDAYFASRPRAAQIAAWASDQSQPIASRAALLERLHAAERRFGAEGAPVPRPPHWGGYRLHIERIELWVGADGRAHDRALWTRALAPAGEGFAGGSWSVTRLQP
ncbi:MAG: pyridoxamine 5'-phosphate oxidase [Deltaproteobacteria bacterium]|nr:MAG: pyridoxamine 5'-phosphate oxidase [Deltaproteobacteria bacterium]